MIQEYLGMASTAPWKNVPKNVRSLFGRLYDKDIIIIVNIANIMCFASLNTFKSLQQPYEVLYNFMNDYITERG